MKDGRYFCGGNNTQSAASWCLRIVATLVVLSRGPESLSAHATNRSSAPVTHRE